MPILPNWCTNVGCQCTNPGPEGPQGPPGPSGTYEVIQIIQPTTYEDVALGDRPIMVTHPNPSAVLINTYWHQSQGSDERVIFLGVKAETIIPGGGLLPNTWSITPEYTTDPSQLTGDPSEFKASVLYWIPA